MKTRTRQALFDCFMTLVLWSALIAGMLFASCNVARGQSTDPAHAKFAVVRVSIPTGNGHSIGGSATVISTAPGRTLLLSAAHVFAGAQGKRILLSVPTCRSAIADPHAGIRVVALDRQNDLALLEYSYGPLPYCCPVATSAPQTTTALSVGYDDSKEPPAMRPTRIKRLEDGIGRTLTAERPWHGRSGGAIIDESTGTLIGVCSGYDGPPARDANRYSAGTKRNFDEVSPGANGLYASHSAILRFLERYNSGAAGPAPRQAPRGFAPQQRGAPGCPT